MTQEIRGRTVSGTNDRTPTPSPEREIAPASGSFRLTPYGTGPMFMKILESGERVQITAPEFTLTVGHRYVLTRERVSSRPTEGIKDLSVPVIIADPSGIRSSHVFIHVLHKFIQIDVMGNTGVLLTDGPRSDRRSVTLSNGLGICVDNKKEYFPITFKFDKITYYLFPLDK